MTIEQLDHLKICIGIMSGALSIQQDAIKKENVALVWAANRDMRSQIEKLNHLISEVKV